jgi:tRNA pseudouridine55 synthase
MFSAKKVDGERLYRAARDGREVEREPVRIVVYSMEMMDGDEPALAPNKDGTRDFCMIVRCSSGTYIRTLAHDIGESLRVGAHLAKLRRTQVGHFRLADGLTLEKLETMDRDELFAAMISPSNMLSHLPVVALDEEQRKTVTNGRALPLSEERAAAVEPGALKVRLCDGNGGLVAVGDFDWTARLISPRIVLAG